MDGSVEAGAGGSVFSAYESIGVLGPWVGASLRAEPFLSDRTSLVVEGAALAHPSGQVSLGARVGVRRRLQPNWALGAGLGTQVTWSWWERPVVTFPGLGADVEIAYGRHGPKGGWSVAARPGVSTAFPEGVYAIGYLPVEVAFVRRMGGDTHLGFNLLTGVGYGAGGAYGGFGAGVSLYFRSPDP